MFNEDYSTPTDQSDEELETGALTLHEINDIMQEIELQPKWRKQADREADYADGKQLDSDILRAMQASGIPPAMEDRIGPAINALCGYEAKVRTDWRVTSSGEPGSQDVADALNFQLNQAERFSGADKSCSKAFRGQIVSGLHWVEVKRESDITKYPYKCTAINRNHIWWDMKAEEDDLSDARWLMRTKWVHPKRLSLYFPHAKEIIRMASRGIGDMWTQPGYIDGGNSTGLMSTSLMDNFWTRNEDFWYNPATKEIAVAEFWYRRWVAVDFLKFEDGRVVEIDQNNPAHYAAIQSGMAQVVKSVVSKMRRAYWLGPHMLHDSESPYAHGRFPYVPFWGFVEDNTGVPYGFVRRMVYSQDSLNSAISKLRWGLSVTRIERTKGAVAMSDDQLRAQVARPDADIILDANHMARQGARFEVKRDFQLSDQQFRLIDDNRVAINQVSNITDGFQGRSGNATSGTQEQTQVDQSTQAIESMMDNFREARRIIGEILISFLTEDLGKKPQVVVIEGNEIEDTRTVYLNKPEVDPESGYPYLSNDVQRTRLKVALSEVPQTQSFKNQQLTALSEVTKSLPPHTINAVTPFMVSLMDMPYKKELVQAIKQATQLPDEKAIAEQIEQGVQQELAKKMYDLKARELDMKENLNEATIKRIIAETVQTYVQSSFSSMQAGAQIAQMPMIAPIADAVMQTAGFQNQVPQGVDPNFPQPQQAAASNIRSPYIQGEGAEPGSEQLPMMNGVDSGVEVEQNKHPTFPALPSDGPSPESGMNTPRTDDNLPTQ